MSHHRLLYVTPPLPLSDGGGRAMLSRLHRDCLAELLGDAMAVHMLEPARPSAFEALAGRIDGVTQAAEDLLIERIARERITALFLNGSNLGRLARALKRRAPGVEVLTFCHNVEARFFLGGLRHRPGPRALAVLAANIAAERMAVKHSDRLIALNPRDSSGLRRLYGRGATDLLPMAIADSWQEAAESPPIAGDYLLFVGGGFYANRAGIAWFAREVAPHLSLPTCVVGRGLEDLRAALERTTKVRLIGEVGQLAPWYSGAKAVIAPIFDGSGMKTKVAEALMHGKRVIGTREAFVGYEDVIDQSGRQCDTAAEFIATLRALDEAPPFDPKLRLLYEREYSYEAARERLGTIVARAPEG